MQNSNRLALCHYWVAFGVFLPAVVLGAWQMLMRSPLPAPLDDPAAYYASVTLHGTAMAYVVTTFFTMGFGYAVAATSLERPIRGEAAAWIGFAICLVGTLMAVAAILSGQASVLYTFYPPLLASGWYYGGAFLLIGGSMIWVVLMVLNMTAWKRDNPGRPCRSRCSPSPRPQCCGPGRRRRRTRTRRHIAAAGFRLERSDRRRAGTDPVLGDAACDRLFLADAGLYRLLYAGAAGRRRAALQRYDGAAHLHHVPRVFASCRDAPSLWDPEHGSGFKFLQSFLTFLVALPTLLTVFSICASLEIAGRVRGGRGLFGWIPALPWDEPMVLAVGLSLVMLGLGGFGGLINMSYAMNSMIHNTSWVTAHFHLIFGGAVVIMYFAIAYEMWPRITGQPCLQAWRACSSGCGSGAC